MPNPTGKNQHKSHDEKLVGALTAYHRKGVLSPKTLKDLLLKEHGIDISERGISRCKSVNNLKGPGATTKELSRSAIRQHVLDNLETDPLSHQGPRIAREAIRHRTGVHLTRDAVENEMRIHDPEGFIRRAPTAKKVHREPLVSLGPNHEWSADGHDKLTSIGFPIWGVRDKWSGKWLGLWVVPNNRLKDAVAYLYLSLIHKLGGMPIQSTTDCGSETTEMFALANALRDFFSDLDATELAAHRFMRSIHNITVERGWFHLRIQWGDNIKVIYLAGSDDYDANDPVQFELHQWLWPRFIQQELDEFRERSNAHATRFDSKKLLPSGVSPNVSYALCEQYNGENCLIKVDKEVVQALMDRIGVENIQFVEPLYEKRALAVYEYIGSPRLTTSNVWQIFAQMLPFVRAM